MSPKYEYERIHYRLIFLPHRASLKDIIMDMEANTRGVPVILLYKLVQENLQKMRYWSLEILLNFTYLDNISNSSKCKSSESEQPFQISTMSYSATHDTS
jgi:hypothetical protein